MSTVSATAALQRLHLKNPRLYINEPTASLRSMALARGEGSATQNGSFVATTGKHTGRSTADRFIVQDTTTAGTVWWGSTNQAMAPAQFEALLTDVTAYLNQQPELFVQQCHVGARAASRKNVLCINTQAWHSWFARNMFIPATEHGGFNADFTILHAPDFTATPSRHGCRSGTVIALNIGKGVVIIAGTAYAGEMKKSIFSLMNYWLPEQGILPMHASANTARSNNGGKSAVFFGLSGTGKTTLSTDAARPLIGDDEHGWDDNGLFNFEGGCYAKAVNLSKEAEPEIYATTSHPETLMENVVLDANGNPDFTDTTLTENTRISYPIHALENIEASGTGGHPTAIVMLTCDATGVLPPVSILSKEQALYHFLSGYTA